MRKIKKLGFISIELVIIAAIVMAAGLAGITALGGKGGQLAKNGTDKVFDLLNWGGSSSSEKELTYDEFGYADELKIKEEDINPVSDFIFAYNNILNGWTVTGYLNPTNKDVIIPSTHSDGRPVVEIGPVAFMSMGLNSVAIPNSVVSIADGEVNMSDPYSLPTGAFMLNRLTSVIIPDSVTHVGDAAFFLNSDPGTGAGGISKLYLSKNLVSIGDAAFTGNALNSIVIPEKVTSVGAGAFLGNFLTSFSLPKGVTIIKPLTFGQNSFTVLSIPDSVVEIQESGFADNHMLKSLTLPKSLKTIGARAFEGSTLESIKFSEGLEVIGVGAFLPASPLEVRNWFGHLELPESLFEIGDLAFKGLGVTSIKWPTYLEVIGHQAFEGNKLTGSLVLPEFLEFLGEAAFLDNLLSSVTLNRRLREVPVQAFRNNSITTLIIPEGVEAIHAEAFLNNDIKVLSLPASLKTLSSLAFAYNTTETVTIYGKLDNFATAIHPVFEGVEGTSPTSVAVPGVHLAFYKSIAANLGVHPDNIVALEN